MKTVIKNKSFNAIFVIKNSLFAIIEVHWRASDWVIFKDIPKIKWEVLKKPILRQKFKFDVSIRLLCHFDRFLFECARLCKCPQSFALFFATPFAIWLWRACTHEWGVISLPHWGRVWPCELPWPIRSEQNQCFKSTCCNVKKMYQVGTALSDWHLKCDSWNRLNPSRSLGSRPGWPDQARPLLVKLQPTHWAVNKRKKKILFTVSHLVWGCVIQKSLTDILTALVNNLSFFLNPTEAPQHPVVCISIFGIWFHLLTVQRQSIMCITKSTYQFKDSKRHRTWFRRNPRMRQREEVLEYSSVSTPVTKLFSHCED